MRINAFDREAHLSGVHRRAAEDARGDDLGIDIAHHDRGVVAAEFEGDALDRRGGAGHDLLPGLGRPGEADLGDARMRGHVRAEVVLVGDDIDYAGGEDVGAQFSDLERRQRRRRRRFDDHCIAGEQRGRQLERDDQHREVPRDDQADDAERFAALLDPAIVIVLDDLGRQFHPGEVAQEGRGVGHFGARFGERLALFLGQQTRQVGGVGVDRVGQFHDARAAVLERGLRPALERGIGSGDGFVELGRGCARAGREHFLGRRIDDVHRHLARHQLAADKKRIFSHGTFL